MSKEKVVGCKKGCEQKENIVNGKRYTIPVPLDATNPDRCKWFKVTYDSCKDCPYVVLKEED